MRYSTNLLLFVLLMLGAGCSPSTERDQKVGRIHRAYVDMDRTNWAGDGPRPLATTIWYPTPAESAESEWSAGVFQFGRSAPGAAFAETRKRPLIVMSHGTGGSAAQLSWLAEELVQEGFIVAAVNHHGNTATEDKAWPHGFIFPSERARDLSVLIEKLLADARIGTHVDASRIGAAGFSLGGYAALATGGVHLAFADRQKKCMTRPENPVCRLPPEANFSEADIQALSANDPIAQAGMKRDGQAVSDARIRAVYAIAPAFLSLMESENLATVNIPLRFVLAEQDQQILFTETLAVVRTNLPTASVIEIPDAGHYVFLAPCSLRGRFFLSHLCNDPGPVDRVALHKRVGADAARFFDATL